MKQEELDNIIDAHQLWIASSGKQGSRLDLSGVSLRGLEIKRANLSQSRFFDVNFQHTKFYMITFRAADFSQCDFSFSELSGCVFHDARIIYSIFSRASFYDSTFSKSLLEDTFFRETTFSGNVRIFDNRFIRTPVEGSFFYQINKANFKTMPQLKEIFDRTEEEQKEELEEEVYEEKQRQHEEGEAAMQAEADNEIQDLKKRILATNMSKDHKEKMLKELKKLASMPPVSAEATTQRVYIDHVLSVPWSIESELKTDLNLAEEMLDSEHYGLEKVKERVLEYLAVNSYTKSSGSGGTILCLYGPPGVGKTSIVASIAKATGRELVSVALGGVSDEAEIRGHRRTYVGSMPGKIINALKKANKMNPVILLDEIDKMGSQSKGDPAAALLEVLDPSQNKKFNDHYIDMDVDLSGVMFIATANSLSSIPGPLRDRMEIVSLTGYTNSEKTKIGTTHLANKVFLKSGLTPAKLKFSEEAVNELVSYYTREAGVRTLEKEMSRVCRKIVKAALDKKGDLISGKNRNLGFKNAEAGKRKVISKELINQLLGPRVFEDEVKNKKNEVGFAQGLAYTSVGGCLVPVEVVLTPGNGSLKVTGQLGDVMKESTQIALTYVQSISHILGVAENLFASKNIHIHFPDGSQQKDGPSAGLIIATAITSAVTGIAYDRHVAGTGEIDLRGNALPIGGVREKLFAAYIAGSTKVFIPQDNVKDLREVSQEVKDKLSIVPVSRIEEVLLLALDLSSEKGQNLKISLDKALGLSPNTNTYAQSSSESIIAPM